MATNPFDDIPVEDGPATAVANPFDAIPNDEAPAVNPFDEIPTGDLLEPTEARRVPAMAAVAGGPKLSIPAGSLQSTLGDVAELAGETLTRKGLVTESGLPMLSDKLPEAKSGLGKFGRGAAKGTEELARGIADFFTSPSGLAQIGLAATPLAPAVYAKWALEMAHGALESGKQSIEDFKKDDWEAFGKNLVSTAGALAGSFMAGKHGARNVSKQAAEFAPRGTGIEPVEFKLPPLGNLKPTHDLNREFQKTHPGATPIPTVELESVPLDPATGMPLPTSAQATINKAAQRLAEIQARGGQPNASQIPSATGVPVSQVRPGVGQEAPLRQSGETPGAKAQPEAVKPLENPPVKVVPEVQQFMADFYDPQKKVTNASNDPAVMTTEKAGMAVKSLDDLKALAEMDARNKAELAAYKAKLEKGEKLTAEEQARRMQIGMRVQFPREVIETATNSGSWSEANGTRVGRPLPNRPLDWAKNPEVEKWLRANAEKLGIKLEDVKVESIEDFKKREDARKASLANQGAAKPPAVGEPPKVPAPQVAEAVKANPKGVDVTHLNKADRRSLRLQGIELTQQPDGKLIATLPVKKAKAPPAPKAPQPKRMAEISEPDKLVWYKTNPKYLATLTKRLGQKGLTEKYVLDSIEDNGRIAFTEAIDPKLAEFLRLKAEPIPKVKGENMFAVRKQFTNLIQEWGERMGFVRDMNRYAAAMTKETGENQGTIGIRGKIENDRTVKAVHEAILKDLGLDPADKSLQAFSKALPLLKAKIEQFKALEENFLTEDNFAKTRISTEDLSVGDTLTSNGVAAEVIAIQADGSVRLKSDAIGEQKLKPGQNIWLDITDSKVAKAPKYEAEIVDEPGAMDVELEAEVKGAEPVKKDMTGKDLVDEAGKDDLKLVAEEAVDAEKAAADAAKLEADRAQAEANQGKFQGMGAAVPEEFAGEGGDYVSNMFAAIDRDRAAMGKPPMEPGEPRTWDTDNQIALAKMNREPDWIPRLLAEVKANPRPLLSWENAGVVWYRARLRAEANNALARVNRAYEDGNAEAKLDAQLDAARFEGELMDLDATVGRGGTGSEAGRTLQAQKMGAGDDFTLVEMRMQRRALENDGAPLTDKQEAEVKALHDKLKATQEAFDKYVKEQAEKESARLAREALEEIERAKNKPKASDYVIEVAERWVKEWDKSAEAAHARIAKRLGRTGSGPDPSQLPGMLSDLAIVGRSIIGHIGLDIAKFGEAMISKFGDFVKPHIQAIFDASKALVEKSGAPKPVKDVIKAPKPPKVKDMTSEQRKVDLKEKIRDRFDQGKRSEITQLVQKLARQFVEDGVRGWEALLDEVHAVIREIDPEFTRRETMDAISGYGQYKRLAKDEISVALREAKGEMQQVAKIEDITAGEKPKPTGIERRTPSEAERAKIKLVNELKKKHPELFEGSGLKSALESRKTYYRNRMSDLREEISNRELAIKNKTAPPMDAELQAIKAEYEIVKSEHDAMFKKGITDAERLRLALAGVERQMADLQRKIATKDFAKRKPSPIAKAPELVKLKAQRDLLRDEFNELRDLNEAYQREQAAKKLERDKATLERAIAEAERKIKSGDLTPPAKPVSRPAVPELEVLKQRLEALQKQIAEARKPVRSEADILLSQFKARRARQIADWERRIAEGDFSKRARKEIRMDREANELQGQAEKVKNEYLKARWEWMQAQRSTGRKIWDAIQKTRGATVNIASSFDFSAPRQAALSIMSNITRLATDPVTGARMLGRPAKDMFRAWASDRAARGIEQQIRNRPNALSGADKIAKIEYSDLDSNKFTKYEENAHSILDEWAELPFRTGNRAKSIVTAPFKAGARGVRMSNRAFITYLNQTRAMLFDELLRVNFKDRPPTKAELELIGNMVNIATGRGKMKPVTAQVSSEVLWAPKLLASRVQFLTGQPLWTGEWANSSRGRMIVAKEYARIIAGGLLLATVSRMFSDKKEDDPRSSDFGKIVRGNTRIDPWGGLQQVTTLGARLGTASTKTLKGAERDVGIAKRYGQRGPWYIALDFIRSKLRPDVGTAVDIINRADFTGKPVTPGSVAKNLFVPLPMREIVSVMRENGFTEGMIIEALGQFGAGVSVYEDKESQR